MVSHLYLHIVWTTWRREPKITEPLATFLCRFLRAVAHQESATVLSIGIVSTHLHILIRVAPITRLPRLVQRMKGGSAVIARKEGIAPEGALKWAKGYSIQSVSKRQLPEVVRYLRLQPAHHPDQAIPRWNGDEQDSCRA